MDLSDYDTYVTINGISKHAKEKWEVQKDEKQGGWWYGDTWNESNPGFGITLKKNELDNLRKLTAGIYKNSNYEPSIYAGYEIGKRLFGDKDLHLDAGLLLGGVTGYIPDNRMIPVPAVVPTISAGNGLFDVNLRYQPEVKGITPEVYSVNFDYLLQ